MTIADIDRPTDSVNSSTRSSVALWHGLNLTGQVGYSIYFCP